MTCSCRCARLCLNPLKNIVSKFWMKHKWVSKKTSFWLTFFSFIFYVLSEIVLHNLIKEIATTLFSGFFIGLLIYFFTVVVPEMANLKNALQLIKDQYTEMKQDIEGKLICN